jgi:hypothetical protein
MAHREARLPGSCKGIERTTQPNRRHPNRRHHQDECQGRPVPDNGATAGRARGEDCTMNHVARSKVARRIERLLRTLHVDSEDCRLSVWRTRRSVFLTARPAFRSAGPLTVRHTRPHYNGERDRHDWNGRTRPGSSGAAGSCMPWDSSLHRQKRAFPSVAGHARTEPRHGHLRGTPGIQTDGDDRRPAAWCGFSDDYRLRLLPGHGRDGEQYFSSCMFAIAATVRSLFDDYIEIVRALPWAGEKLGLHR